MKLITIRHFFEYLGIVSAVKVIQILPHCGVRMLSRCAGRLMYSVPSMRRLVTANIATALPELPEERRRVIARESFRHLALNISEFLWMEGNPKRVRRCYPELPPPVYERLTGHRDRGERIIFVNPHLGSWECSGLVVPLYAGIRLAAVARPLRNPFLNKLYNRWREDAKGLKVVFSKGAVKASIAALRAGDSVGTLIDQNTKVRDGGEFIDFFGLPVTGSTAPAMLKRYCSSHGIPAVILYGSSVRVGPDEHLTAVCYPLAKPFEEYSGDREIIEELVGYTERTIREYPEQYLWLYKRFQYIPEGISDELRRRYPYYAKTPGPRFYRRRPAAALRETAAE